ncbi:Uma2 family endonuclease [soil metagenome]
MSVALSTDPAIRLRGLRRPEYDRLVLAGAFAGERVELLGGALIEVSPQGSRHAWVITELGEILTLALHGRYKVRQEKPLAVDGESEPEPDLAVTDATGPDEHPSTAALVVEVAQTTQRLDLGEKARRYAAAAVQTYVVLDLPTRRAVVHSGASPAGYGDVRTLGDADVLTVLGVDIRLAELF